MIKISKQIEYALEFLFELSRQEVGEVLSIKTFSKNSNISFLFLQRIAKQLRESGLILSTKGFRGGYVLSRPAHMITLGVLVEAVEGPPGIVRCMRGHSCDRIEVCRVRSGFKRINDRLLVHLSNIAITDLM